MSLSLLQSTYACGPNGVGSFLGTGGSTPYVYSLLAGGAGGAINASTGAYTAPPAVPTQAAQQFDTVVVTDAAAATATAQILIGDALLLFCDVVARGMSLDASRVWIFDQKIFQPTDNGLYVTVAEMECRVIANNNASPLGGATQAQYVTYASRLEVDLISRDNSARLRRTDFLAALNTVYAQQQQRLNGFSVGWTTKAFTNVSTQDGTAIPYRYKAWVGIQYSEAASSAQQYFDTFQVPPVVAANP